MSKAHFFLPSGETPTVHPVRLGAGNAVGDRMSTADEGKLIKLVGESRYDLCVAGDAIEGVIYAVEPATSGGYSIGGRVKDGAMFAIADGIQLDGTGVIAVGDYVVAGAITAKGTKLASFAKVRKATSQTPGVNAWRVMSLGSVGTGAVGSQIVIERV